MFGNNKKIEDLKKHHILQVTELEQENAKLQNRILELESSTATIKKDTKQTEFVETLLDSYENGNNFLQQTVDSPIEMLQDINSLNTATTEKMIDVESETSSIAQSVDKIQ